MSQISMIVAMAKNRVIGCGNDLPWHIPEDLKRFKMLTTGKPVMMGRKTFESILARINKPLPDRKTIIISRDFVYDHPDVLVCKSVDDAIFSAKNMTDKEIMIAGGAQIYKQTLPFVNRIYMTELDQTPQGDAWFPETDDFQEVSSEDFSAGRYVILERSVL